MSDRLDNKSRVDLGWDKMAGILDKEMPVSEDKRRPVVLWWLGGASILVLLITASWFLLPAAEANHGQPVQNSNQGQMFAEMEAAPGESEVQQSLIAPESTSGPESLVNEIKEEKGISESAQINTDINKNKSISVDHSNGPTAEFNKTTALHKPGIQNPTAINSQKSDAGITKTPASFLIEENTNIQKQSVINSQSLNSAETAAITADRYGTNLDVESLNSIELKNFEISELEIIPVSDVTNVDIISTKQSAGKRISFGIEGGLLSENLISYGGYTLGGTISYPLGQKWSLTSGLAFQNHSFSQQKRDDELASNLRPDEILFTTDPGIPSGITTFPGTTNSFDLQTVGDIVLDNQIRSLEYLNIPVRVDYRVNRAFSFFAGASASYLLGATFYDGYAVSSDDTEANVYDVLRIQPSETTLGKWDVQGLAGLGYHISSRFSLELSYNYGFIPIVKQEEVNIVIQETNKVFSVPELDQSRYNRYFSLRVRYGF